MVTRMVVCIVQATVEVLAVADQTIKDAFTLGRGKAKEDKARIA